MSTARTPCRSLGGEVRRYCAALSAVSRIFELGDALGLRRCGGVIRTRQTQLGFAARKQRAIVFLPRVKAGTEERQPSRKYLPQQPRINQKIPEGPQPGGRLVDA